MRRRDFILVFAAVPASVRPLRPVRAQTTGLRRVGVVFQGGPYESSIAGLRDGLRAAGLEDGRHVTLFIRNAQGDMADAARHGLIPVNIEITAILHAFLREVEHVASRIVQADPRIVELAPNAAGGLA